ncbi:hypothetical protein CAAN1_01S07888 [[Candida] anglica]|uniref:Uncharacterized protein n=1 Tax=[Candida] anglica TaxID=148631 RepID=A0ABP0EJY1_9ASCO
MALTVFGYPEGKYTKETTYHIGKELSWMKIFQTYVVFSSEDQFNQYKECIGGAKPKPVLTGQFTPFNWSKHMVIKNGDGQEFCWVESKWLIHYHCRRFVLHFTPNSNCPEQNFDIVLLDSNLCTYSDTIYKNTRIRFSGTSTTLHEEGVNYFRLVLLENEELGLLDNLSESYMPNTPLLTYANHLPNIIKRAVLSIPYDGDKVEMIFAAENPKRDTSPFGVYRELFWHDLTWRETISNFRRDSTMSLREIPENENMQDSMVMLSIVLVLKQQDNERQFNEAKHPKRFHEHRRDKV